jgi:hypothetical protein
MAQLAVAAAGAALGAMLGPPGVVAFGMTGAGIGWTAGAILGGVLFPPKMPDGGKLDDLSVQVSTYGIAIARSRGTVRHAGNVIWASDLTGHEVEGGGKGGSSYSTTAYSCSFAVGVCAGPKYAIRRIWADGKLKYDARSENEGPHQGFNCASMTIYLGTEDQEPDPTLQAALGDTPAYRGLVYVVFADLWLEKFGNRLPNLTFEVVESGTQEIPDPVQFGERYDGHTFEFDVSDDGALWIASNDGHAIGTGTDDEAFDFDATGVSQVQRYDPTTQSLVMSVNTPNAVSGNAAAFGNRFFVGRGSPGTVILGQVNVCGTPAGYARRTNAYHHGYTVDASGNLYSHVDWASSALFNNVFYWASTPGFLDNSIYWIGSNGLSGGLAIRFSLEGEEQPYCHNWTPPCSAPTPPYINPSTTVDHLTAPGWSYRSFTVDGSSWVQGYISTNVNYLWDMKTGTTYQFGNSGVVMPQFVYDSARETFWVMAESGNKTLYQNGVATGFVFDEAIYASGYDPTTNNLFLLIGNTGQPKDLALFNPITESFVWRIDVDSVTATASGAGRLWAYPDQRAVLFSDAYRNYWIPYDAGIDDECVSLADVVLQLSLDAGLTEDDVDVSELTDCILGFLMPGQATARSSIEQLMLAYAFDAVQSGLQIKFVKRGKTPVATIPLEDLAAHRIGEDVPAAINVSRVDDVALPARIAVRYVNRDSDYLVSTQLSQRLTGRAQAEMTVDVPIVLSDAHAKAVADLMLFTAWTARNRATWQTNVEYLSHEATDVVTVVDRNFYVTKRTLEGWILKFEGEGDPGLALIGGAVAAASLPPPVAGVGTAPLTDMLIVDSALLRDADDSPGAYLALWPNSSPEDWKGAQLWARVSGGAWSRVASVGVPGATLGVTLSALGDWTGGHVFDATNQVVVQMANGELASATRGEVLAGGNIAAVGAPGRWEIVAYQDVELTSDGDYRLSRLLRGLFGTEWAIGTHNAGDRFFPVNLTTVVDFSVRAVDLGVPYEYRPVSTGRLLETTATTVETIEGERLVPLAGANLRCARDIATGDATITWDRRSRLGARHLATTQPPLGEDAEEYEVEIYVDDTFTAIIRTFTGLTSAECDYSASLQGDDFSSGPPSSLSVRVYQISAQIGRGHALEGTV